ncbi:MAG: preprotein translocase subunit SecE [Bryobacteraceae bacterium]|nr:preprotein translocase subunit SecE [Bryobacteraceae bacterium]
MSEAVQRPTTEVPTAAAGIATWPAQIKEYVEDLQAEMRKVTWPTPDQVKATTAVVVAAVFGFAAFFFLVDIAVAQGIDKLFRTFAK